MSTYQTQAQIDAVVQGFESCTTNKADFKHQDHLTVAVYYLQDSTIAEATDRLRESLFRFVDHYGIDRKKYNETITIFWLELVAQRLKNDKPELTLLERCNEVIAALNNSSLALEYYSANLLYSDRARHEFVEPDLKDWRKP